MKVNIELDSTVDADRELLTRLFSSDVKPEKKPKPVTPVTGNPDPVDTSIGKLPPATNTVAVDPKPADVKPLKADAPEQITKLELKPGDKETLGNAILKACKPVNEGGVTRPVVIAILEKFRPAGNTDALLKLGVFAPADYPKIAALILNEYRA